MRSFHVCGQTVATALMAFGIGLAVIPTASADPSELDQPQPPAPGPEAFHGPVVGPGTETPPEPAGAPGPGASAGPLAAPSSGDPTKDACGLFNKAVNYAAINYEDFADYSAGSGNYVNYGDPTVDNANVAGRTALKQAAAASLAAATTPGVPPEVTAPMQAWSMKAAKLVLVMGVRGGGDTLNSTATDLNKSAHDAQMACAAAASQT